MEFSFSDRPWLPHPPPPLTSPVSTPTLTLPRPRGREFSGGPPIKGGEWGISPPTTGEKSGIDSPPSSAPPVAGLGRTGTRGGEFLERVSFSPEKPGLGGDTPLQISSARLSDKPRNPSPLMGEGKGGGEKDGEYSSASVFPPPLCPLPPGEGKVVVGLAPTSPLQRGEQGFPPLEKGDEGGFVKGGRAAGRQLVSPPLVGGAKGEGGNKGASDSLQGGFCSRPSRARDL